MMRILFTRRYTVIDSIGISACATLFVLGQPLLGIVIGFATSLLSVFGEKRLAKAKNEAMYDTLLELCRTARQREYTKNRNAQLRRREGKGAC